MREKTQRFFVIIISVTAIAQLALSQLSIGAMRQSAEELAGISYFAFIILGLVALFTVSRMRDSFFAKFFAVTINFVTALAGLWCLYLLFSDEVFFQNIYYTLDRQTQVYEQLSIGGLIFASIPLALIILGTTVYSLCGLFIIVISLKATRKNSN